MEAIQTGKEALIASIQSDALAEQEKIVQEAKTLAAEKKADGQRKAEDLLKKSQEAAAVQAAGLWRKITASADLEIRRRALQIRQELVLDIQNRVLKKFAAMISEPNYRTMLIDWIAEAAVGLDAAEAKVNASASERRLIDEHLLAQAAQQAYQRQGKAVTLTLSDAEPLEGQGISLTAGNGRIAYNNQIQTRMLRKQSQINLLIHDALFAGTQK